MISNKPEDEFAINGNEGRNEYLRYFALLWKRIGLILFVGVVAAAIIFYITSRMVPTYETSTNVLIIAAPTLQTTSYNSILTSQNLVPTYADLLMNESILAEVIRQLELSKTTESLGEMIKVNPIINTSMIKITVEGTDKTHIASIANTLVAVFIEKINALQSDRFTSSKENLLKELNSVTSLLQGALAEEIVATDPATRNQINAKVLQYQSMYANLITNYEQVRLAEVQATSSVVQIDQAGTSFNRTSPNTFLYSVLAGMMGSLLTSILIIVQDAFDTTIKSVEEITHHLKLPVLGIIYRHNSKNGPIVLTEPRSPASDAFRSLRTNLQYVSVDTPIRSILVASPLSAEGRSTICVNLAVVMAQAESSVILIDADFHRPIIHQRMNLANNRGLITLLGRSVSKVDDILQNSQIRGLSVITVGEVIPPNITELLNSKKVSSTLTMLLKEKEMMILDAPPILPVADSKILAPLVDGVLLVVQSGQTTLEVTQQAVESLRQVNARIIGVVLNNVDPKTSPYMKYYRKGFQSKNNIIQKRAFENGENP